MMLLLTDVNVEGKAAEPKSTSGALIIKQSFITTVFTASGGIIRHFINNNAIGYLLAGSVVSLITGLIAVLPLEWG
ncbi:hypothetical protein MJO48_16045 [Dickeya fangzhongdai]|uniref:hypothetical protein n=1 Tax=Dickeya fangzhongdai TaxID=1778540 RepID=UPI001EFAC773|nr:hypothetical protein [Dickeya fangzhongdai]ULR29979.1 hypothetical protein MJO48_16045 [Dickeya fangzhongdai]